MTSTEEPNFLTKSKFSKKVEKIVSETRLSYMDAVIHICEAHNIDPGDVKKFLNDIVKGKIEAEARALNFLPKEGNQLPI